MLEQPADAKATASADVVFTAALEDPNPIRIHWKCNGLDISKEFGVTGIHSTTLTVHFTYPQQLGEYSLNAYYPCGVVRIRAATLTYICGESDWNVDGVANSTDVSEFINMWFYDQALGTHYTDVDDNGVVDSVDVSVFIDGWFGAPGECH